MKSTRKITRKSTILVIALIFIIFFSFRFIVAGTKKCKDDSTKTKSTLGEQI
jgi:uncharacterized membrane protein